MAINSIAVHTLRPAVQQLHVLRCQPGPEGLIAINRADSSPIHQRPPSSARGYTGRRHDFCGLGSQVLQVPGANNKPEYQKPV